MMACIVQQRATCSHYRSINGPSDCLLSSREFWAALCKRSERLVLEAAVGSSALYLPMSIANDRF